MLIGTEEKKCKKMASTQETKRPKKILKKKWGTQHTVILTGHKWKQNNVTDNKNLKKKKKNQSRFFLFPGTGEKINLTRNNKTNTS